MRASVFPSTLFNIIFERKVVLPLLVGPNNTILTSLCFNESVDFLLIVIFNELV